MVVYPGRIHLYQGYSAAEVTALVRHAHHLGCRDIVFALRDGRRARPGARGPGHPHGPDQPSPGATPLAEWDGLRDVESPFVDMNEAYSPYLRTIARGVADDLGIAVEEGVYAGVLGPCFETPAEVAALRTLGVSYVGMSTVCEVIMARALGMSVLGLTPRGQRVRRARGEPRERPRGRGNARRGLRAPRARGAAPAVGEGGA